MPRPLSITEMELSGWMMTLISLQKPASASSTALSTTSNTMWCSPVPSWVSPMYMPGRLRTASRPFSILMLSAVYSPLSPLPGGSFLLINCSCVARAGSDAHGHDHVLEVGVAGHRDQGAGVGIAEGAVPALGGKIVQNVQEVGDVEAHVQGLAVIIDF